MSTDKLKISEAEYWRQEAAKFQDHYSRALKVCGAQSLEIRQLENMVNILRMQYQHVSAEVNRLNAIIRMLSVANKEV